jgi:hypothetical protein
MSKICRKAGPTVTVNGVLKLYSQLTSDDDPPLAGNGPTLKILSRGG